jgi:hypothetical protein
MLRGELLQESIVDRRIYSEDMDPQFCVRQKCLQNFRLITNLAISNEHQRRRSLG